MAGSESAALPKVLQQAYNGPSHLVAANGTQSTNAVNAQGDDPPAVRFASGVEEIEPSDAASSLQTVPTVGSRNERFDQDLSPEAKEEIRTLAMSLQKSKLQESRIQNYSFEPVSLPPSRAHSRESSPHGSHRRSTGPSPGPSRPVSVVQSPPLTPAGSHSRDSKNDSGHAGASTGRPAEQMAMTPQTSPPHDTTSPNMIDSRPSTSSEPGTSTRPTSISDSSQPAAEASKRVPRFSLGPSGESSPGDESPSAPGTPRPGSATPPLSPRQDPQGDDRPGPNRGLSNRNLNQVDPRFMIESEKKRKSLAAAGALPGTIPRVGSGDALSQKEKRTSIFGNKKDPYGHLNNGSSASLDSNKHHGGSMSELKRFFRIGGKHHKRAASPAPSRKNSTKSGTKTPPHQMAPTNVPFADDHGLEAKYGKFGKVLGSGAGGSVRVLKRSSDGVTFAVKQFRERHSWESEKDYSKKVTAEFCIGSTLHHGNVIETLDIIQENHHWYEVMEYAPFDLFAIVMTGKMSREEVACSFLQIVNGVSYLHSMGLAHRDLKLDNVVVNDRGIMKLIDFGSATVFQYPFENEIVLASGIVGSDPYLAPEVYDERKYDPRPTDVWSLAIIYCCMTLRRFPWKQPRLIDNSYKLFVAPPTPGTPVPDAEPRRHSEQRPRSSASMMGEEQRRQSEPRPGEGEIEKETSGNSSHGHHHHRSTHGNEKDESGHLKPSGADAPAKQEVVKGPWRLLRILPRETRHIVGRMLKVDPAERATMQEVLDDDWVTATPVCSQEEQGQIYRAAGHTHTLEPGNPSAPAPNKK